MDSKPKRTTEKRKEDGIFKKKNIKHDPKAESARAVFDKPGDKENTFGGAKL